MASPFDGRVGVELKAGDDETTYSSGSLAYLSSHNVAATRSATTGPVHQQAQLFALGVRGLAHLKTVDEPTALQRYSKGL